MFASKARSLLLSGRKKFYNIGPFAACLASFVGRIGLGGRHEGSNYDKEA